jgi:uncharacterized iron-regulated protein
MKFNIEITVDEYDGESGYSLQDQIIEEASSKFIEQILGRGWDKTSLYDALEKKTLEKIESLMDVDFKNDVAQKVSQNLQNRFEKTKQYKELIAGQEVSSDAIIKTGLKELVSQIVKSEMKNIFSK